LLKKMMRMLARALRVGAVRGSLYYSTLDAFLSVRYPSKIHSQLGGLTVSSRPARITMLESERRQKSARRVPWCRSTTGFLQWAYVQMPDSIRTLFRPSISTLLVLCFEAIGTILIIRKVPCPL